MFTLVVYDNPFEGFNAAAIAWAFTLSFNFLFASARLSCLLIGTGSLFRFLSFPCPKKLSTVGFIPSAVFPNEVLISFVAPASALNLEPLPPLASACAANDICNLYNVSNLACIAVFAPLNVAAMSIAFLAPVTPASFAFFIQSAI